MSTLVKVGQVVRSSWGQCSAWALGLVAMGNALLIGVSADANLDLEALAGVTVFGLGGGPLFVAATTTALAQVSRREAGLVWGIVTTCNQLGAATCVAVASTVAAAGLTSTPSIEGFTDAFTRFAIIAAAAAVLSLRLLPSRTPHTTQALHPPPLTRYGAKRTGVTGNAPEDAVVLAEDPSEPAQARQSWWRPPNCQSWISTLP